MTTERSISFKHRYLGLAALLIAPAMLGARGCHVAVVGSECGGLRGEPCDSGEFCDFEAEAQCGAADRTGTCELIPEVCTDEFDPVCGCDGTTYGNACSANAAGVSVASEGECEQPGGETCGGLLGAQCGDDQFCDFAPDAACGAADQTGVCTDVPEACTRELNPVCGCDDNTYPNACVANSAGVSVARQGECEPPPGGGEACGGLQGLQCADDEFCNFAPEAICGAADQTGICSLVPEACDSILDPVCGCDGETYSSDCVANQAGVSVASRGECEPAPGGGEACGGLLGAQCGDGQFCAFAPDAICGAADQTGICTDIPQACTREFNPVCGCDGVTYSNPCIANSAGTSVSGLGDCDTPPSGDVCGGLLGAQCGDGEFCAFPADAFCGAADATGICARRPEACTEQYDPVCGCDGQTYGNACSAASAGVSVSTDGECEPSGSICGGLLGAQCGASEFCDFPVDAICGAADQTGNCRPVPEVCTDEFNPVCGCNDVTFANRCEANAAGVSVASTGECSP